MRREAPLSELAVKPQEAKLPGDPTPAAPWRENEKLTRRRGAAESEKRSVKKEACRISRFANVWQKRVEFAKDWQKHPPRRFQVLPNIGKIA
jgi:hypothetical protein